jgi:hypothetical protein
MCKSVTGTTAAQPTNDGAAMSIATELNAAPCDDSVQAADATAVLIRDHGSWLPATALRAGYTVLSTQLAVSERDITVNNLASFTTYTFSLSALSAAGAGTPATVVVTPSTGAVAVSGASAAMGVRPAEVTRISSSGQAASGAAGDSMGQQGAGVPQMPPPGPMDANGVQNMQNGASCREDLEPAAPQGFSATPDGTGRIALSWGNGDASICTGTACNVDVICAYINVGSMQRRLAAQRPVSCVHAQGAGDEPAPLMMGNRQICIVCCLGDDTAAWLLIYCAESFAVRLLCQLCVERDHQMHA